MEYFHLLSGGLGDLIWMFFADPVLRRLSALRKKYPAFKLQLVVSSLNSNSWEVFRGQADCLRSAPYPVFFESVQLGMGLPYVGDLPDLYDLEEQPIHCFLTPEEKAFVNGFPLGFVAVHPFAGDPDRSVMRKIDVKATAKFIHRLVGKPVVIFGGSHTRTWSGKPVIQKESFQCKESYITSLVDEVNIRVALHLLNRASWFVGTHSALMLAAWRFEIPTLILGSNKLFSQYLNGDHPLDPYHRLLFAPGNYFVREEEFPHLRRFLARFLCRRPKPPQLVGKPLTKT